MHRSAMHHGKIMKKRAPSRQKGLKTIYCKTKIRLGLMLRKLEPTATAASSAPKVVRWNTRLPLHPNVIFAALPHSLFAPSYLLT